MTEHYQKIEKIGEGTYGVVYKAMHQQSGRIVALKKIRLENDNEGVPATTVREISLLKTLKHPNIIDLMDVIYMKDKLFLVFEFIEMDLRKFLDDMYNNEKLFLKKDIKRIASQILKALHVLHSRGILHRDIKPQNILINSKLEIKLADFGLGRFCSLPLRTYTHDIVTLWYRPPELLLGSKYYSAAVDIWSAGCIFAELLLFKPLFPGDSCIDQLYRIFRVLGTPNDDVWMNVHDLPNYQREFPLWEKCISEIIDDEMLKILEACFIYDPVQRVSAKDLLNFDYFNEH